MIVRKTHAFSLVELLVVVAVVGLIAAFAVPATQSVLRGSALNAGATLLADQMSMARQHAISHSRPVEVRFYRFGDPEAPGERADDPQTGHFRALQLFERGDTGMWIPVGKATRLPDLVVMSMGGRLSTLIGENYAERVVDKAAVQQDPRNHIELPRNVRLNYEYIAFRFLPNGSTDLPPMGNSGRESQGGLWHVTLHSTSDLSKTNPPAYNQAPPNYVTWMVDPVSGIGRTYRPGLN